MTAWRSSEPTGCAAESPALIFGVGAHRTGTSSLAKALTMLGYRTSHWADNAEIRRDIDSGVFRLSIMDRLDAVCDLPIPTIWYELATAFPEGRFILTIRSPADWIDSVERHTRGRRLVQEEQRFYRRTTFDHDSFLATYMAHNREIMNYFGDGDNLLVIDLTAGEGWHKLCSFLNVPLPDQDVAFPRESVLNGGGTPPAV